MMCFSCFFPLIQLLSAQQNVVIFASISTTSHNLPFILPFVGLSRNCSLLILIVNSHLPAFPAQSLWTSTIMQRFLFCLVLWKNPSSFFFHKAPKLGFFYSFPIQVLTTDMKNLRGTFNTADFQHGNLSIFLVCFSVNKKKCVSAYGGGSWD